MSMPRTLAVLFMLINAFLIYENFQVTSKCAQIEGQIAELRRDMSRLDAEAQEIIRQTRGAISVTTEILSHRLHQNALGGPSNIDGGHGDIKLHEDTP